MPAYIDNPPSSTLFSYVVGAFGVTTSTAFDAVRGTSIMRTDSGGSGEHAFFRGKAVPASTPWTATMRFRTPGVTTAGEYNRCGLSLYDTVSGKLFILGVNTQGTAPAIMLQYFTSLTTYSSTLFADTIVGENPEWFQISFDGTTYTFQISYDNAITWVTVATALASSYFTANKVGAAIETFGTISANPPIPQMLIPYYNDPDVIPPSVWASVETPDTFSGAGYVGAFGQIGNLASTEATDVFAATGYPNLVGTWSSTEARDIFSSYMTLPITGVLAATEASDRFSAAGLGLGENGIWLSTEAPDIFAAVGNTPISGTFITTEAADRFAAIGAGVTQVRRRRVFFVT
jgi:hypothetical protein